LASVIKLSRWTPPAVACLLLGVFLAAVKPPLSLSENVDSSVLPDIIFVQAPMVVTGEFAKRFPRGSRLVRLASPGSSEQASILTPDFFAAADPRVSADASKVLFSGQKSSEARWQVWEMKADGSNQRQITNCDGDCLGAAYLPGDEIVYSQILTLGTRATSALFVAKSDGSASRQITFGPGDFRVETVLRDGRILVSADSLRTPNSKAKQPRSLYSIRTDGTGLSLFRSDSSANLLGTGADQLENGAVLFVSRGPSQNPEGSGQLAWIPPGAMRNLRVTPRQFGFWSAHELDGNTLVVSRTSARTAGRATKYDLYTFNLASRTVGKLIYRNPELSSVQAVPLEPHPEPRRYFSILHPAHQTGRVICLNAYFTSGVPNNRLAGPIARVRVLMLEPDSQREVSLGEAPVEKDGSFYVAVPADHPIRFELLSLEGRVIRAQRSWVWTRGGEDMGCAGCHEDKAQAPANHWPMVLNRFDMPMILGESNLGKATDQ
jgi:Hydrazine synthase alpha subunit middle domain